MPISGNASYLPTADTFISHWTDANAEPGGTAVLTATGISVSDCAALRAAVDTALYATTHAINSVELTRATLARRKLRMRQIIAAFNEAVRGRLGTTSYPAALPAAPGGNDSPATVAGAAEDVAHLWGLINADSAGPGFTPPLMLRIPPDGDPDGDPISFQKADFDLTLGVFKSTATALRNAEQNLILARDKRDRAKKLLYDALRDYRLAIPGFFPAGHPIRETLPALNPAPGHTPDPVTATAAWDPALAQARITHSPSDDPALHHYALRHCPGSKYSTDDEITLASHPAGGSPDFLTLSGLETPGLTALYRVYVITATGNERGSNTVSVTRPPP